MSTVHTFEAPNLVTKHVTVYQDRAEVKKCLNVTLIKGFNEVVVNKLTKCFESDSIRVDGRGKAVIIEVKYQEKFVKREEDIYQEEKRLRESLSDLRDRKSEIEQQSLRLKKQKEILDGVCNQISSPPIGKSTSCGVASVNDDSLKNLESFLCYFSKRAAEIDTQTNQVQKKLKDLNEEITISENNLKNVNSDDSSKSREVSIVIDALEDGEVDLDVSYVVRNASWTPSYDLRVFTNDNILQISYYGMIQQNTNEDWNDAKFSLSTATPSIGGQVPELNTLAVGLFGRMQTYSKRSKNSAQQSNSFSQGRFSVRSSGDDELRACGLDDYVISSQNKSVEIAVAEVKESIASSSFEIGHKSTIPSDNTSHKVTIALLNLRPDFEYETVPSKSAFAYLKAKVTNGSTYPFLPGPTAVFLDNNFVAKSQLNSVSPGEEFYCSLGVDPSVRVDYKPVRKFHDQTGFVSKSSIINYEQTVEIKNTKAEAVKVKVLEQLPLSNEEKVKIQLVEPNLSKNHKNGVQLNKKNNIEWELVIPSNETQSVVLKYRVEHPRAEQLEFNEV